MSLLQLQSKTLTRSDGSTWPVYYLDVFYPMSDPQYATDSFSHQVIGIKDGHASAVEYFYARLDPIIPANVVLTVIPGHTAGPPHGGMRLLVQKLCKGNRVDGSDALVRAHAVAKSAGAKKKDRPTPEMHRDSITVNNSKLKGKPVFVLDDVVTLGASMRACLYLVLSPERGAARDVTLLALGGTRDKFAHQPHAPVPIDLDDLL